MTETAPVPVDEKTTGRLPWLAALFAFAVFFFCYSGKPDNSIDGRYMIRVTHNLLDHGSFSINAPEEKTVFSKYGIGLSLVYLPMDALGKTVGALLPVGPEKAFWVREFILGLSHAVFGALTVAGAVLLLLSLGLTPRQSVTGGLLSVFSTALWVYAKADFAESLQACCLVWLFYVLGPVAARRPGRSAFWAGGLVGLLFLSKVTVLLAAPVAAVYALVLRRWTLRACFESGPGKTWPALNRLSRAGMPAPENRSFEEAQVFATPRGLCPRRRWVLKVHDGLLKQVLKELLPALVLPAVALGLFFIYNTARFGNPLETGYGAEARAFTTPLLHGVFGLTVFPTKSVFVFAPLTVLLPVWLLPGVRRGQGRAAAALGVAALALLVVFVLFYARWYSWNGGLAFGPRFQVPVMPLGVVAVMPLVVAFWKKARVLLVLLGVLGVLNAAMGLGVRLNTTYDHGLGKTCVEDWLGITPFDYKGQWAVRCWPPAQVTQAKRFAERLPRFGAYLGQVMKGQNPPKPDETALDFWWAYLMFFGKKGVLAGALLMLLNLGAVVASGWWLWRSVARQPAKLSP